MRDFVNKRVKEMKPSGIRRFFEMSKNIKDVVALSVGEPDFPTPEHISKAGIDSIEKKKTFYTSNAGMPVFRI